MANRNKRNIDIFIRGKKNEKSKRALSGMRENKEQHTQILSKETNNNNYYCNILNKNKTTARHTTALRTRPIHAQKKNTLA
jgi:flagellar biosynthesis chaperone FliJ